MRAVRSPSAAGTHAAPRRSITQSMARLLNRLRRKAFANRLDAALSLFGIALFAFVALEFGRWAIVGSVVGTDPQACHLVRGACWSVIRARYRLILFGLYPYDEQWRSGLACVVMIGAAIFAGLPSMWTARRVVAIVITGYASFFLFMYGGVLGLRTVSSAEWGGLSLTLFIYATVVVFGMPLAAVIAVIRHDAYPAFRCMTGLIIDVTRSLPLLTILFAGAIILPMVLPYALQGNKLGRSLIGFVFFFACYQSEVFRGGLQTVPAGQIEAARSLGFSYARALRLIVFPQVLRVAMPATISQLVITFKETALVVIVGLFDLMASGEAAYQTGAWSPYYREVYCVVGLIYFLGAFSLSRYGDYIERRLRRGSS